MSEKTFTATIAESSKELSAKERLAFKDTADAIKLDTALGEENEIIITPYAYVVLDIHNEKSKDRKDYQNYVIVDVGGNKFVTGSESFWRAFSDIWNEMKDEDEEYSIKVYTKPSKNYTGKNFITCSIC